MAQVSILPNYNLCFHMNTLASFVGRQRAQQQAPPSQLAALLSASRALEIVREGPFSLDRNILTDISRV